MRGKFITGALIGAAVSMIMIPEIDRSTKRRIRKTARMVRNAAGNVYENMMDRVK